MQVKQYVTYYRVSTKGQGDSGLGLEAQRRDIEIYLARFSSDPYEVIGEFTDIQSGKSADDRPQLQAALTMAKRERATLLVAKLDRLSRNNAFIANLVEDKRLSLAVAALPNADNFQIQLFAVLAEKERTFISERTKAALVAAKARGVRLGGLRPRTEASNTARRRHALAEAESFRATLAPMVQAGMSCRAIAAALAETGIVMDHSKAARMINRLQLRAD